MAADLAEAIARACAPRDAVDGVFPTPIEHLRLFRFSGETVPRHLVYKPALCVAAQGGKRALFGGQTFEYCAMQALVVSLAIPASSRVWKASADEPFLGLVLDLEIGALREVLEQLDEPPRPMGGAGPGVFVLDVEPSLADCLCRLVRTLDTPKALRVLYPLIAREICYWLLVGPHGSQVRAVAFPEGRMQGVSQAVSVIRQRFDRPITVPELARAAGMGLSTFHHHFKALTGLSPIQYQKQLRLHEGRRLMVEGSVNVETAALRVGYESVPQFSRDYARRFGASPKKDADAIKAAV